MKHFLAEACENTFILFDCLEKTTLDPDFLDEALDLLKREGRDDVLVLMRGASKASQLYVHMAVWGLDGTFGEFCANGARACAAYLYDTYPNYNEFFLTTTWGEHPLQQYEGKCYSVQLPLPSFALNPKFVREHPLLENYHYVEIIEPHLVLPQEMNDDELMTLGKALNKWRELFPKGININSYSVLKDGSLKIRTYERGVQRLTQACGTGSIACAAWHLQNSMGKLYVINPGGALSVTLTEDGVILKGEGSYV